MDPKLWDILAEVARETGRENWHITSGYRSPRTNAAVGGVPRSFHSVGRAVDVRMPANEIPAFVAAARRAGAGGIGIYRARAFVHIDTRDVPYSWG